MTTEPEPLRLTFTTIAGASITPSWTQLEERREPSPTPVDLDNQAAPETERATEPAPETETASRFPGLPASFYAAPAKTVMENRVVKAGKQDPIRTAARHARREELARESLSRAASGQTMSNFPEIFEGFAARGIPMADIRPRENVFTFNAWRALRRHVRRGEKGVRITTWIPVKTPTGEPNGLRPMPAYVFHISQTDPD